MIKLRPRIAFFLVFFYIAPAYAGEDISLDRLMLLHDILPDKSFILANELTPQSATQTPRKQRYDRIDTPLPYRVLIDIRSNHSDGAHNFNTLIPLAEKRYIDALAFTEHDRYSIRLGLDPVPHIFGYSQEHPSLYQTGVDKFFADLNQAQQHSNITLFAGTESTPGYYWQGIPFKNLSLHDAEKHIITLGATTPEHIKHLTSYTLEYGYGNTELSLTFWFVFIFGLIFILMRKRKRGIALLVAGSFIAFITTWLMKPHINPDQAFIQSAHEQGLFTIWTHPGTKSGVREGPMGVQLVTPPYNNLVFQSKTTDAFAATYGDSDDNTVAGGAWDNYLKDYMDGYLAKPIWAVAAGDYHEEGQSGEFLGNFPMDVWSKSANQHDILNALKHGHMAAWQMKKHHNLSLSALSLEYTNPETKKLERLRVGDMAAVNADITLIAVIIDKNPLTPNLQLQGQWIIDGSPAAQTSLSTDPSQPILGTPIHLSKGRHVIRFQIPAQQGVRMEANPFLVQVRE